MGQNPSDTSYHLFQEDTAPISCRLMRSYFTHHKHSALSRRGFVLSHMNSVIILTVCVFNIDINVNLQSVLRSSSVRLTLQLRTKLPFIMFKRYDQINAEECL